MMRKLLMVIVPLAVLALGGMGAGSMIESRPVPEKHVVEAPLPLVRVSEVNPQSVRLTVATEGTVAPRTESELVPEVSGRVIWVSPSLASGGFLEKGEDVLKIEAREYELAVIRARAAVAQAKLQLATEEQEAELARKEWDSLGKGDPTALTLREPQIAGAKASLASAQAALEQTEYDAERTVVKAPYDGRVREKKVDVGQFVSRGTSVATIYAVDFAEVRLPIPDDELAYLDLPLAYRGQAPEAQGPSVTLRAQFAGKEHEWQGRIVRTEGEIDARSRMIHAIAQVADPYGEGKRPGRPPLAVGLFVNAEIQGKATPGLFSIPRSAMRGDSQVIVVDSNNRLRFRDVDIFRAERDRVLLRSGVEAGERICISPLEAAVEGMEVRVDEAPEKKPAGRASGRRSAQV
jgi:RND family efflux transporter MFP subunit